MTPREAVTAALNGETPDYTPLAIYDWFVSTEPEKWQPLVRQGLVVIENARTVRRIEHGVEREHEEKRDGGSVLAIDRIKTPAGTVEHVARNGWTSEYWVKSPRDYTVFQWIAEHTELEPCYCHLDIPSVSWQPVATDAMGKQFGGNSVMVAIGTRTPAMVISVDYAGPERFGVDLLEEVPELFALYDALEKVFVDETRLMAAGPGRFVKWLENFTANMFGPDWYEKLLMPMYRKCVPMLEAAGKRVMVHYDGQLAAVARQVAAAPIHIIESLTEPPEGDMTYDRCREAWPDKAFWAHLNVATYALPPDELRREVAAKRERAGKKGLAFEISEDIPPNWPVSFPIVMETLRALD